MNNSIALIASNTNCSLANKIAIILNKSLTNIAIEKFKDSEINIKILDNIVNKSVYVIHGYSTDSYFTDSIAISIHDHIMLLLLLVNAIKKIKIFKITVIIPYLFYSRDENNSKMIVTLLQAVKVDNAIFIDLHSPNFIKCFKNFAINVNCNVIYFQNLQRYINNVKNFVIVAPDQGSITRVKDLAEFLNIKNIIVAKKIRLKNNCSQTLPVDCNLQGKVCILIDDIIDTAQTICNLANKINSLGAVQIIAYCTHAVLSENAIDRINDSYLNKLIVTDTIALQKSFLSEKIKQISIADLLAKIILDTCFTHVMVVSFLSLCMHARNFNNFFVFDV